MSGAPAARTRVRQARVAGRAYVSLETPDERDFALRDPPDFLARDPDGAILDEIQRAPDLVSCLRGFVDDDPPPGRWILTGSQHFHRGLDELARAFAGAGDTTSVRKVVVYGGDETQARSGAHFLALRDIATGPWTTG